MLCGVNNTYRNETIDLTTRPNLYYLNALDLLNPVNMLYAKSVCVADCPGEDSVCGTGSMPCTNDTQYRWVCMVTTGLCPWLWLTRAQGARPHPPTLQQHAPDAGADYVTCTLLKACTVCT
jgi:hypothetical protein